ncbi:MAG: Hsp20/alpha crystallin family protein [Clostridia bacterium]|nr:Hsp20/alpha crystallin family protein [Clostridia bacterium]
MLHMKPYSVQNDSLFYDPFRMFGAFEPAFRGERPAMFKTDIRETETGYELEADLPGYKKEDIAIDIERDCLTITAERKREETKEDEKKGYRHIERSFGSFSRSFDLSGIDTEGIKASYTDGVLKIELPKQQEALPQKHRLEIAG